MLGSEGAEKPAGTTVDAIYNVDGWVRVGRYDSADRRALWIYDPNPDAPPVLPTRLSRTIVMRAGREGDDAYVELRRSDFPSDEKWLAFEHVIACALYAARDARDGGAP
jgi:hypothetical protein